MSDEATYLQGRRNPLVREAVDSFPEEFALRGFPNDRFRLRVQGCYHDTGNKVVWLVVEILTREEPIKWLDFARVTVGELANQIRPLKVGA